eukprot:TRINITY_DN8890_c0_g1_i1.p1 TRINITY_DN8890_c0_g1~~TRINITY_DN8890_c0_g1_i1.p1  ORF type:complete len:302 (-),score=56.64 TRINITY_DN8890_c0_g1_i1:186-1034(-)
MVFSRSYQAVLGVVAFTWVRYGLGFSISNGLSDIGVTQENPARSGQNAQSINLECRLNFNSGEKMTLCKWVHSFPDVWAYDDREAFVMCIAAHESDDGKTCEDQGNIFDENSGSYNDPLLNPYTAYDSTRLIHRMTENICGLTIQSPHANDTGIWKCHVNDNNPDVGTQWAEVDLFVANESVVAITDPDMYGNTGVSIEVDLSTTSRVDVDAECTAEYGILPRRLSGTLMNHQTLWMGALTRMNRVMEQLSPASGCLWTKMFVSVWGETDQQLLLLCSWLLP